MFTKKWIKLALRYTVKDQRRSQIRKKNYDDRRPLLVPLRYVILLKYTHWWCCHYFKQCSLLLLLLLFQRAWNFHCSSIPSTVELCYCGCQFSLDRDPRPRSDYSCLYTCSSPLSHSFAFQVPFWLRPFVSGCFCALTLSRSYFRPRTCCSQVYQ